MEWILACMNEYFVFNMNAKPNIEYPAQENYC